jgi:hypothetical protein
MMVREDNMERSRTMRSRSSAVRKTTVTVLLLAVALLSVFALSPAASAQTTVGGEGCFFDPYGEEVCPDEEVRKPDTDVQAELLERAPQPAAEAPSEEGPLPFTGADVTLFLVTGAALVVTGTVLVRRNRTRRDEI